MQVLLARTRGSRPAQQLMLAAALAMLAGCAGQAAKPDMKTTPDSDWKIAATALRSQQWEAARVPLSRLMQQDLRNGNLQFLYALTEENLARDQDRSRLDMAAVGYANASRFAPGHYWALLRLGYLELERGDWRAAQSRFAEATQDQPRRWEAFYGLGVASYYRRDLAVLQLAAARAMELAPEQPDALRLGAFALAAEGDIKANGVLQKLALLPDDRNATKHSVQRVAEFLDSAPVNSGSFGGSPSGDGSSGGLNNDGSSNSLTPPPNNPTAGALNQVVVEVTILLSSVLDQANRGVNLFDGLRVLYGYTNTLSQIRDAVGRQSTRTITSQISTPQLDYSLDLFNDSGQYYNVVARPSITAHLGRESQFFAGRTVNVEVSGINLGQLQPIDVGVRLSVVPEVIDQNKVTFRVDAARSFLSQEQIGTFTNSLTTFRQSVSATADIEFGQTLVLSAMSEQVQDKSFSKVPGIGDVPVANWLTSHSSDRRRQESLLILVTPTLPLTYSAPESSEHRERAVAELLSTWRERIDPNSDVPAILKRLKRIPWLRTPEQGDLRLRLPESAVWEREALEESLSLART